MNRRGFLSRVGAVAAVVPALRLVEGVELVTTPTRLLAAPPDTPTSLSVVADTSPELLIVSAGQAHVYRQPDLLTIRRQRGLMAPCPNCGETKWKAFSCRLVRCEGCDWQDYEEKFVAPCPCRQCVNYGLFRYRLPDEPPFTAERLTIDRDAPVGIYAVTEVGRAIRRTQLNGYDVCSGRMIHRVVEEQIARIDCAIWLLSRGDNGAHQGFCTEKFYQPNGNRVGIGWHIVDCYEWQVDRGEKPEITYTRGADGRTTLAQGVVR